MGPFEMVVAIVIVVTIGKIYSNRQKERQGYVEDEHGNPMMLRDPDADKLREEVTYLKERVAVLEKIATDDRGARELENEIEKLRDR